MKSIREVNKFRGTDYYVLWSELLLSKKQFQYSFLLIKTIKLNQKSLD